MLSLSYMEDMEPFGDNVESFLSQDDGDEQDIFSLSKISPAQHNTESSKGFTFAKVSCIHPSDSKVVCCHFSLDGKLLASAGHEKKWVVLWNMATMQTESTTEEHGLIITDVCFRPNSTQLATSSFDRNIRLWNAAEGHTKEVHSVCWDVNGDLLASVSQDSSRVWSLASGECIHELNCSRNKFHSCVCHPSYSTLLVIGGYQVTLQLALIAHDQPSQLTNYYITKVERGTLAITIETTM